MCSMDVLENFKQNLHVLERPLCVLTSTYFHFPKLFIQQYFHFSLVRSHTSSRTSTHSSDVVTKTRNKPKRPKTTQKQFKIYLSKKWKICIEVFKLPAKISTMLIVPAKNVLQYKTYFYFILLFFLLYFVLYIYTCNFQRKSFSLFLFNSNTWSIDLSSGLCT